MPKIKDKRLVLLSALLRYADLSGTVTPHFYRDDMLKTLGVCEHVFNIMQKQLGDRYCRLIDCFDGRSRYAINVDQCFELRDHLMKTTAKVRHLEGIQITVLTTLIGVLFVILLGQAII